MRRGITHFRRAEDASSQRYFSSDSLLKSGGQKFISAVSCQSVLRSPLLRESFSGAAGRPPVGERASPLNFVHPLLRVVVMPRNVLLRPPVPRSTARSFSRPFCIAYLNVRSLTLFYVIKKFYRLSSYKNHSR